MKLTRQQLKQIIKEELEAVLEETDQLDEEEDLEEGFKGSTDVGVGYNPDDPDKEESEATIVQRQWRQQNQKYSDEQREKEKTKPKVDRSQQGGHGKQLRRRAHRYDRG
tara:strand:- start:11581 stop:11907 length:327 start_codon:yes stop_codon:yes gene_type:complete